MGSVDDILQLCRLCLVKDQVNIPIFDETSDIRQTFLKINSCLPVKVSRDDSLPKKICDGCSYKLDMLYVFRNTSVDSEKQLLSWLDQIGLSTNSMLQDQDAESEKPEVTVKQEALESSDRIEEGEDDNGDMGDDSHSYLMQQQKLPYQDFEFGEPSSSNTDLMGSDEPAPKRAKRAAAMKKHVSEETEEDELDAAMQITKAEDEDSDEIDNPDFGEEEIPSTSADDQDQPGPSGVGKGSIEAPFVEVKIEELKNKFNLTTCIICNESFLDYPALLNHRHKVHKLKESVCHLCGKTFKKFYEYQCHACDTSVKELYKCDLCSKAYNSYGGLYAHKRLHNKEYKTKSLTCPHCDEVFPFTSATTYYAHRRTHTDGKPTCHICNKTFRQNGSLKAHISKIHEKPDSYPCLQCNRKFSFVSNLKQHVRSVHNGEKILCEICGKGLGLSKLRNHMMMHRGEKPHACEFCSKRFTKMDDLRTHLRVHTKEKPYKCTMCDKRFTQVGPRRLHIMTIHSGERPFECNICTKRFTTKSLLNTHLKAHLKKAV